MGRIHLGSIFGTTITIDLSFLILIAFFVFTSADTFGMPGALLWAPVIFISILFHEFAHAAMIGVLGHGSSAIVLEGIGGVTINQRQSRPWQDVLISAAGPATDDAPRAPNSHPDPMIDPTDANSRPTKPTSRCSFRSGWAVAGAATLALSIETSSAQVSTTRSLVSLVTAFQGRVPDRHCGKHELAHRRLGSPREVALIAVERAPYAPRRHREATHPHAGGL